MLYPIAITKIATTNHIITNTISHKIGTALAVFIMSLPCSINQITKLFLNPYRFVYQIFLRVFAFLAAIENLSYHLLAFVERLT